MKRRIALLLILLLTASLCACGHQHTWKDATCTEPKTCTECGATEGEPLGHDWKDATCTEPKTCSRCGAAEGEPLGHDWKDATCTEPKTCSRCGATEGEPLGHDWKDATCTEPKTCVVCGETDGEALGHTCEEWTVVEESTCTVKGTETGVCTVCGETLTRELALADHTPGEWQVTKKATISANGTEVQTCTVCGQTLNTRSYKLDPFDISLIRGRSGFKYDEFNKSWQYSARYEKKYSDATETVAIIMFSESNGTNLEDVELQASLIWKDSSAAAWPITGVEFLVNGTVYHVDMTQTSSSASKSYSILYDSTSYKLIQELADASRLKLKIIYQSGSSEYDLSSNPFRTLCRDIVNNNIWDYYIPNAFLAAADTTRIR